MIINKQDNLKYFGNWTENINELSQKFINAKPFSHIKIENINLNLYQLILIGKYILN